LNSTTAREATSGEVSRDGVDRGNTPGSRAGDLERIGSRACPQPQSHPMQWLMAATTQQGVSLSTTSQQVCLSGGSSV
jgi:hypothetical protein